MNYKSIGEIGQNCVIGELSKYSIGVAPVLSDNYPFEMIAIAGNNLFKIQVKTSTENKNGEYIKFHMATNNWHSGQYKGYTKNDCDVIILYDLVFHNSFLITSDIFENQTSFTIRYKKAQHGNGHGVNWFEDYIISPQKIKEVFDFEAPDLSIYFCDKKKKYQNICQKCGKKFKSNYRNGKYCSALCRRQIRLGKRKVERPSKEELMEMIRITPMVQIGKQFGVSDNAIRKWARSYDINIKQVKGLIDMPL